MLNKLPTDLLKEIVYFLDTRSLICFSQICQATWDLTDVDLTATQAEKIVCWSGSWHGRLCSHLKTNPQILYNHKISHPQIVLHQQAYLVEVVDVALTTLLVRLKSFEAVELLLKSASESVKKYAEFLGPKRVQAATTLTTFLSVGDKLLTSEEYCPGVLDPRLRARLKVHVVAKAVVMQKTDVSKLHYSHEELCYLASLHPSALWLFKEGGNGGILHIPKEQENLIQMNLVQRNPFYFWRPGTPLCMSKALIQSAIEQHPFVFYLLAHNIANELHDINAQLATVTPQKYKNLLITALGLEPRLLQENRFVQYLNDTEVVKAAFLQKPSILDVVAKGAANALCDLEFASLVLRQFPQYYSCFPPAIKQNKELILQLLESTPQLFKYLEPPLCNDEEIAMNTNVSELFEQLNLN